MANPLIIPVALGVGFVALVRAQSGKAGVGKNEIAGKVDATAAAANPGTYTDTDGSTVEVDAMGTKESDYNGSTSTTPSGGTLGGDTSTTPSAGPVNVSGIGGVKDPGGSASPVGPAPGGDSITGLFGALTPHISEAPADTTSILAFGNIAGTTTKQQSRALAQEGPALGMVW